MAGATATPARPTLKILRGEHAAAQTDAAVAVKRERDAEATWKRFHRLTRPDSIDVDSATAFERADAVLGEPEAKRALAMAQRDSLRAREHVEATAAAVTAAEDAEIETELRATCPPLLKMLRDAQPVADRIAELVQRHSRLRSGGLQFPAVQSSSDRWTSPLDTWADGARASDLIERE
jgi:hypothetical protein